MCVCHTRNTGSRRSAGESERVVLGRSVCVCVSYEECRLAVGLLERVSVSCWAGPSVCVCVSYEESVGLLERERERVWVCVCVRACVRACVCVSVCASYEECRVAIGLLERVSVCVGQVRLSVCVSYEECCVVVSLLERVSVWCWAGPSVYVCVIRGTPSS